MKIGLFIVAPILAFLTACSTTPPPKPIGPLPSPDQLAWHEDDVTMFVHFGMNTFTGLGTGHGDENPDTFNPTNLDCKQWAKVAKETGFKGMILVAKHHDGFCLWPTATTKHSVKYSKWENGKGDVVRNLSNACKEEGIKFGVYCSPWDRSQKNYNTNKKAYTAFYRKQLTELLSNYGPIYEMWFDGNRAMIDDWSSIIKVVRTLQPHAIIKQGPRIKPITEDARWVGNEFALAPLNNWNVYPAPDQNSTEKRVWFPVECDPKTMSMWFWVDEDPTPLEEMLNNYYTSVGRGSVLLFNVPPNKEGRFSDAWVAHLKEFHNALNTIFKTDLAQTATITATNERSSEFSAEKAIDNDLQTYWASEDGVTTATLTLTWEKPVTFNVIRMEEQIALGQRIAKYKLESWDATTSKWKTLNQGFTIGRRKLDRVPLCKTTRLRLTILKARACPTIRTLGVYHDTLSPKKYFTPALANFECDPKHRHRKAKK